MVILQRVCQSQPIGHELAYKELFSFILYCYLYCEQFLYRSLFRIQTSCCADAYETAPCLGMGTYVVKYFPRTPLLLNSSYHSMIQDSSLLACHPMPGLSLGLELKSQSQGCQIFHFCVLWVFSPFLPPVSMCTVSLFLVYWRHGNQASQVQHDESSQVIYQGGGLVVASSFTPSSLFKITCSTSARQPSRIAPVPMLIRSSVNGSMVNSVGSGAPVYSNWFTNW